MYTPVFVKSENELNKIIKQQKRSHTEVSILFTSLWDPFCKEVVSLLKKAQKGGKKVYVVNSFTMPHAFVIYKTTKLPHLVTLRGRSVESIDYLPLVYQTLGL